MATPRRSGSTGRGANCPLLDRQVYAGRQRGNLLAERVALSRTGDPDSIRQDAVLATTPERPARTRSISGTRRRRRDGSRVSILWANRGVRGPWRLLRQARRALPALRGADALDDARGWLPSSGLEFRPHASRREGAGGGRHAASPECVSEREAVNRDSPRQKRHVLTDQAFATGGRLGEQGFSPGTSPRSVAETLPATPT